MQCPCALDLISESADFHRPTSATELLEERRRLLQTGQTKPRVGHLTYNVSVSEPRLAARIVGPPRNNESQFGAPAPMP